ncbi:MAG: thioredoxin family protein [Thermoplasmata archaeon]
MERLSAADFDGQRLRREGSWGVCFSADWCPFCRAFLRPFAALEHSQDFQSAIGDLTDTDSPLWELFSIDVVPTMVAFRNGEPIRRWDGVLGSGLRSEDVEALRALFAGPVNPEQSGKGTR